MNKNRFIQKYGAIILFAFLMLLNAIYTPNFLKISNFNNIITQIAPTILISVGMTLVISTGGIDLTVGSYMALSAVITAKLGPTLGFFPSLAIALVVCVFIGVLIGFMVGEMDLQPMVVTLGMMIGVRGIAQVLNDGKVIYLNDQAFFSSLGTSKIAGSVPIQIVPIIISVLLTYVIAKKSIIGRRIQSVGDNIQASILSGIDSLKTFIFVYASSAFLSAFAGIFAAAKIGAVEGSTLGSMYELDAIAAVAIGGTPMSGGEGKILGTVIGALIMQLITLTVTMNNIPEAYARILKAMIIVVAVYIQGDD